MSGYNEETGIFELTATKADYWLRRKDIGEECLKLRAPYPDGMKFYACILKAAGLEVTHVDKAFLRVKGTPEAVFEALSGQPSNPARAAHYYSSERKRNPTDDSTK